MSVHPWPRVISGQQGDHAVFGELLRSSAREASTMPLRGRIEQFCRPCRITLTDGIGFSSHVAVVMINCDRGTPIDGGLE